MPFEQFYSDLSSTLYSFSVQNNLNHIDLATVVFPEDGSKRRGDFSMNLMSPKYCRWQKFLQQIGQFIIEESRHWKSFSIVEYKIIEKCKLIQLFIDRKSAIDKLLTFDDDDFIGNFKSDQILCGYFDASEFDSYRTQLVANSIANLIKVPCNYLTSEAFSTESLEVLLSLSKASSYSLLNEFGQTILDINSYLEKHKPFSVCYSFKPVIVEQSSFDIYKIVWSLWTVRDLIKNSERLFLVISERYSFKFQIAYLITCILMNYNPKTLFISVGHVVTSSGVPNDSVDNYIKVIRTQLDIDCSEESKVFLETAFRLSLLSTSTSTACNIKLDYNEAVFFHYNYSRFSVIFKKYQQEYPQPNHGDHIELSTLINDYEWDIIFNHFSRYKMLNKKLLRNLNSLSTLDLLPSVIFLKKFVVSISLFYHHVKILTDQRDHLLQDIHAKVVLSKFIMKVLKNLLNMFGIEPLENMKLK